MLISLLLRAASDPTQATHSSVAAGAEPSAWQVGRSHEVFIDRTRALPSFADGPDHQRLAAPRVTAGEHLVDRALVALGIGLEIAARIERQADFGSDPFLHGMDEAHRQQDEISLDLEIAVGNLFHQRAA